MALPALSAKMSSQYGGGKASRCIDGDTGGQNSGTCHTHTGTNAWLAVQLVSRSIVDSVAVWNRNNNMNRLGFYEIYVGDETLSEGRYATTDEVFQAFKEASSLCVSTDYDTEVTKAANTRGPYEHNCGGLSGRYVTLVEPGENRILNLGELQVFGHPDPGCPADIWEPNPGSQSAAESCSNWATSDETEIIDSVSGALVDGQTLSEACLTSWAKTNCANSCCAYQAPEDPGISPPTPPPSAIGVLSFDMEGYPASLIFTELTPYNLPRGAALSSILLHVTPHSGRSGALSVTVAARLRCGGIVLDAAANEAEEQLEWDMQPYDIGFDEDMSPDLAPLLAQAVAQRGVDRLPSCEVVIELDATAGRGSRSFFGPQAADPAQRPRLELTFEPPTTAEQLGWVEDRDCDVSVAVPVPLAPGDTCATPDNLTSHHSCTLALHYYLSRHPPQVRAARRCGDACARRQPQHVPSLAPGGDGGHDGGLVRDVREWRRSLRCHRLWARPARRGPRRRLRCRARSTRTAARHLLRH